MTTPQRVCLVVLDGFGERAEQKGNAIRLAKTPAFDRIYKTSPWTLIGASENDVGLPEGADGEQRGRPPQPGRGPHRLSGHRSHRQGDRDRHVLREPGAGEAGRRRQGQRRHAAPLRPDQPRQRSRRAGARLRRLRAGQAPRADQGGLARVPRRARHAAAFGRRLPAPGRRKAEGDRRRRAGLGGRPLLRDGPRQALGPAGSGVEDADPRRRAAGRRPRRRCRGAATRPAARTARGSPTSS